jgi:hypothetical protein
MMPGGGGYGKLAVRMRLEGVFASATLAKMAKSIYNGARRRYFAHPFCNEHNF